MICCNNCKEWFHDGCVEIPSEAWINKTVIIVNDNLVNYTHYVIMYAK